MSKRRKTLPAAPSSFSRIPGDRRRPFLPRLTLPTHLTLEFTALLPTYSATLPTPLYWRLPPSPSPFPKHQGSTFLSARRKSRGERKGGKTSLLFTTISFLSSLPMGQRKCCSILLGSGSLSLAKAPAVKVGRYETRGHLSKGRDSLILFSLMGSSSGPKVEVHFFRRRKGEKRDTRKLAPFTTTIYFPDSEMEN